MDGLGLSSAAHAGVLLREPALCDVLLHFVRALSGVELSGILISRATVPLASTEVLEVSPVILSELGYTSLSEYQAALRALRRAVAKGGRRIPEVASVRGDNPRSH